MSPAGEIKVLNSTLPRATLNKVTEALENSSRCFLSEDKRILFSPPFLLHTKEQILCLAEFVPPQINWHWCKCSWLCGGCCWEHNGCRVCLHVVTSLQLCNSLVYKMLYNALQHRKLIICCGRQYSRDSESYCRSPKAHALRSPVLFHQKSPLSECLFWHLEQTLRTARMSGAFLPAPRGIPFHCFSV